MKRFLILLAALLTLLSFAHAETFVGERYSASSGYSLVLMWPEGDAVPAQREDIQTLYFTAYPAMREDFGTSEATEVWIYLHHREDSIAYTAGEKIYVSMEYLAAHPDDLNLLVHELFHVVQNGYPGEGEAIGAFTEGMADYARAKYGYFDEADWALPAYAEGQSYMDSYRVTGAFISWLEESFGEALPVALNQTLHEGGDFDGFWLAQTGSTLDELWAQYAQQ